MEFTRVVWERDSFLLGLTRMEKENLPRKWVLYGWEAVGVKLRAVADWKQMEKMTPIVKKSQ